MTTRCFVSVITLSLLHTFTVIMTGRMVLQAVKSAIVRFSVDG